MFVLVVAGVSLVLLACVDLGLSGCWCYCGDSLFVLFILLCYGLFVLWRLGWCLVCLCLGCWFWVNCGFIV